MLKFLCIVCLSVTPLAAVAQARARQACATSLTVGPPQTLWSARAQERRLRLETGTSISSGLLLIGRTIDSLQQIRREAGTVVARLLEPGASTLRSLPVPEGSFGFVAPVLTTMDSNRAILTWGERGPVAEADSLQPGDIHELWYSIYSDARWSTPRRIEVYDRKVRWGLNKQAVTRGRNGEVHLVLDPLVEAGKPSRMIHLRTDGDAWLRSDLPTEATLGHVYAAAVHSSDRLHVALVASPPQGTKGVNAVYFRSQVSGPIWTPERFLFHRAPAGAYNIAAAVDTADGAIHVLWGQGQMFALTALYHMVSLDGGFQWTAPRFQRVSSTWNRLPLTVLALPTGGGLAVATGPGEDDLRLFRFCAAGLNRPVIAVRKFIRSAEPLLLHGAHGSPVLLTSGFLVSGKRVDAVWQVRTITSKPR